MPEHKRHHYVPRCHLRPFSVGRDGLAINLFNITQLRSVRNAAVKGQCAKDYLYGVDLRLEKLLQFFEGEYARIVRVIESAGEPTHGELEFLRDFAFLQYQRTDMAMQRMRISHEGLHNAAFLGQPITPPDLDVSDRAMMLWSMRMFVGIRKNVGDLRVCIIRNESPRDLITSDDPAILTSKFQAQRIGTNIFGVGSSGALIFLPLSPRYMLMGYDSDVHTVPDTRGHHVSITNRADADALNELQYLKAGENIYFSQWDDRQHVEQSFGQIVQRRPKAWHRITVLVPDGTTERGERFRRATDEERRTFPDRTIVISTLHPIPSRWILKLKYRDPVRTWYNGSAAGYVRKAVWEQRFG